MLDDLLLTALGVSFGASAVILLMLMTSSTTGSRFSAKWRYWIWLLLALRLILPVNISLPQAPVEISVPVREVVLTRQPHSQKAPFVPSENAPVLNSQSVPEQNSFTESEVSPQQNPSVSPVIPESSAESAQYTFTLAEALVYIWAGGAVLSLGWQAFSYLRFRSRLSPWSKEVKDDPAKAIFEKLCAEKEPLKDVRLFRNKLIKSPMMTGFVPPVILLPVEDFSEEELEIVLRHELTHCRRHDLWYKLLLVAARCLHWFNPLVYMMLREADRDLEISCDEAVVNGALPEFRQQYCETILHIMRGGINRSALLSTSFYGGKSVLKKRFIAVLNSQIQKGGTIFAVMLTAVVLSGVLMACAYEEPVSASLPSEPSSESSSGSENNYAEPVAKDMPYVSGPDEEGIFPKISEADFDRWVTNGEPDKTAPDASEIVPFFENSVCVYYLNDIYPDITDWEVLYEYDSYVLFNYMYDPYLYQWRDQYIPKRIVVLKTEQSEFFDRIVISCLEYCDVESYDGTYTPRLHCDILFCTGWESELQMGDLSGIQVISGNNDYCNSLWSPEKQKAYLCDYNSIEILPLNGVTEAPTVPYYSFGTSEFKLGESAEDDRFVVTYGSKPTEDVVWNYYDAETQSMVAFDGNSSENPQFSALDDTHLALMNESEVCIYDLSSEDMVKPIAVLGGNGNGLSDGNVWIFSNIATDREYSFRHVFFYYTENENVWRLCTFNSEGEILSDFSTGLTVIDNYMMASYRDGLVFFSYYAGGTGNYSSRRYYCVDARDGYDHSLQRLN